MKRLISIVFWILVGESIVLTSQSKVQKKMKQAQGREKATLLFEELISLNQDLFHQIIKKADAKNSRKFRIEKKVKTIKKDLLQIKKRFSKDGESVIEEIIKKRESGR